MKLKDQKPHQLLFRYHTQGGDVSIKPGILVSLGGMAMYKSIYKFF